MPLSAGFQLGPYEIVSLIGAGGMGEVYRARDPRVGRDVAIKVSQERFSERFDREVRVIASLNHPNICQLYDVGPNYLVMELIEGDSPRGPMSLDEALRIMRQIADALDYAHEKGVVHRDLKPGNVKIKPEGAVKVLDFGLAKVAPSAISGSGEDSPTLSMAATRAGMILGTAAYMAPEQARGKSIDKRADVWAFGVVFFELLTGQKLFKGEDITETLASVVKERPDLGAAPPSVRRLLERCLEKDPKARLRDIGDVWALLDSVQAEAAPSPSRLGIAGWIVAAVLAIIALGLGFTAYRHYAEEPPKVLRFSLLPPEKGTLAINEVPAISPDGSRLAFAATTGGEPMLWIRDLDSFEARMIPGTEGAALPFWSPDGRNVAFFSHTKLKRIDLSGGAPLTLCDSSFTAGGAWGTGDVILFTPYLGGLFRVSAAGGTPTPATVTEPGKELVHTTPQFLPDGRHFLYVSAGQNLAEGKVYIGELDSKERREVVGASSRSIYVSLGYLLFARGQTLMAQAFDPEKALLSGDPVPVAQNVNRTGVGPGAFSVSRNGMLAFATGEGGGGNAQLTWVDRSGELLGTISTPGQITMPSISPDGTKVAFSRSDPQTGIPDIWVHELARSADSRFTFGPRFNLFSSWSPDGRYIAYMGTDPDGTHIHKKATSGPGQDEVIDGDARVKRPADWSRDGKYILEDTPGDPKTGGDVWVLPLEGEKKAQPYVQTEFQEGMPKLSPDGQWLAYSSWESKRAEVYVQTFPMRGGKWQVSIDGGSFPIWSKDGKELYFIGPDGKMMAAEVRSVPGKDGSTFERGVPKPLFDAHMEGGTWFDVSRDGKFLIPVHIEQPGVAPINIVVNWQAALKK